CLRVAPRLRGTGRRAGARVSAGELTRVSTRPARAVGRPGGQHRPAGAPGTAVSAEPPDRATRRRQSSGRQPHLLTARAAAVNAVEVETARLAQDASIVRRELSDPTRGHGAQAAANGLRRV